MVSCTLDMVVDSGSNDARCRVSILGTDASRGTADCEINATLGTGIGCDVVADCGSLTDCGPSATLGPTLG